MSAPLPRAWLPAILWLMVIALESTRLGSTENTGKLLLAVLTFFFGKIGSATYFHIHYGLRKAGHFFGYAVLSLVMFRAWWATVKLPAGTLTLSSWRDMLCRWSAPAALLAILSTSAVAGLDEWHQALLPSRTGALTDVMLDSLAGLFAQMLLIAFSNVRSAEVKKQLAISD